MLSDACFDFLDAIKGLAEELAKAVEHYSSEPFDYGEELAGLREACANVANAPHAPSPTAVARLVELSETVRAYHDTPPFVPEWYDRREAMDRLISLLNLNLVRADAERAQELLPQVIAETPHTTEAATGLKSILSKLGQTTYDMIVKVLTDIASETAKKILGL